MNVEIIDDQPPEVLAMLQALYSRSPKSVLTHLEQVRTRGPDKFMAQYYVGYGHKSIGDCGFTSLFVEQVSLLAAKAIQDTPLYCGQEASTRYLDMAKQDVLNPLGTPEGKAIQDGWMNLYSTVLAELGPVLKTQYPRRDGEDEIVWEKAIKARAFDVARGLLPAGVTTLVAWSANLRQADDHLKEMRHHALAEVRGIARCVHAKLSDKYPPSFSHKRNEAEEDYVARSMSSFSFYDGPAVDYLAVNNLDLCGLREHQDLLETRPPRTELHQRLRRFGSIDFYFSLDFGSYRDLQRQRSAVQEMPLLTTKRGFHPWYIAQMPGWVPAAIEEQRARVESLGCDAQTRQYYTAIGYLVPVVMSCPLPAAVYIAELRSGTTVHPTLRERAQQMGESIKRCVPGIAMHHDISPGSWSVKRGTQDIVLKETK